MWLSQKQISCGHSCEYHSCTNLHTGTCNTVTSTVSTTHTDIPDSSSSSESQEFEESDTEDTLDYEIITDPGTMFSSMDII